jgi:hypothetical protein
LSINAPDAITFEITVDEICPKGEFINGTGTYNGPQSSVAVVKVYSTCYAGGVLLSWVGSGSLISTSLVITTAPSYYNIYIAAVEAHTVGTLTLQGTSSTSIKLDYWTVAYTDIVIPDYDDGSEVIDDIGDSSWDVFGNWFPSLNPILAIFLDIVLLILIIIAVCLFCYVLYRLIKLCFDKCYHRKMKEI